MTLVESPATPRPHWVVHLNRRGRSCAFAAVFIVICSHIWYQGLSLWLLPVNAVSFLVWPQLAYLRARGANDSINSEFDNLIVDSVIFGAWISGLGYPAWIAFTLCVSTCINLMVYRGPRGFTQALWGLGAGGVLGTVVAGVHWQPLVHWVTSTLSASSLAAYLMMVGYVAYTRNQVLHNARERQRLSENELKQQIEENRELQARLEEMANCDPLTGLYNRRYLDACLSREIRRCIRADKPLSVALIDIDHFKAVNDDYGHATGDAVLIQMANILRNLYRDSDIVCRIGGEEFLVVLPETCQEVALKRGEECRQTMENTTISTDKGEFRVTLSAGVATTWAVVPQENLIHMADNALYRAKAAGRNRVLSKEIIWPET